MAKRTKKKTTRRNTTKKESASKTKKKSAARKPATKDKRSKSRKVAKKKKTTAQKKSKRTSKSKRVTVAQLNRLLAASLKRVDALEKRVAELTRQARVPRAARKQSSSSRATIYGVRASAAKNKTLRFTKKDSSPEWVRVSVDGHAEDIIGPFGTSGELEGRTTGEWIIVRVEVRGDRNDKAEVTVAGGSPSSIVVTIPPDDNANNGSQPVLVL